MGIYVILSFVLGFTLAQILKLIIFLIVNRGKKLKAKEVFSWLVKSGGMPSGHSASFGAATTYIGFHEGFNSIIFALALCVMIVIVYDAVNVRYATGEQGKKINKIIEKQKIDEKSVKVIEGHTKIEVLVGIVLGILIGTIIFTIFG